MFAVFCVVIIGNANSVMIYYTIMFIFKLIRYGVIRDKLNARGSVGFRLDIMCLN